MLELIRTWVLGLTAAAFIGALALAVTPKGKTRAAVGLVTGMMTIVVLIAPVIDFDYDAYARHVMEYDFALEARTREVEYSQERLTSWIIIERSETYILDKAEALGLSDLTVRVETMLDEARTPYPYEVWLTGRYTPAQRQTLADFLAAAFGIPAQRQHWSAME